MSSEGSDDASSQRASGVGHETHLDGWLARKTSIEGWDYSIYKQEGDKNRITDTEFNLLAHYSEVEIRAVNGRVYVVVKL